MQVGGAPSVSHSEVWGGGGGGGHCRIFRHAGRNKGNLCNVTRPLIGAIFIFVHFARGLPLSTHPARLEQAKLWRSICPYALRSPEQGDKERKKKCITPVEDTPAISEDKQIAADSKIPTSLRDAQDEDQDDRLYVNVH